VREWGEQGMEEEKDLLSFGQFIGTSSAMKKIYRQIMNYAPLDNCVFITGESGTGKEICAESIHSYSDRHSKPFIALNCAGLSETLADSSLFGHIKGAYTGALENRDGAIQKAEGGSLFLDEICDMPQSLQAKLLRFCQNKTYYKVGSDKQQKADIRIICATNKDPHIEISKRQFREDLYYRLFETPIEMPPVRQRGNDSITIAEHFLSLFANKQNKQEPIFSTNSLELLSQYHWPGNVREIQNIVKKIISDYGVKVITADMLPDQLQKATVRNNQKQAPEIIVPLWKTEQQVIEQAISYCNGNISKAAAMLDISPSTIYRKRQSWREQ
jgi:two-component system repressor protein LuxO